jgi:hypothetical protein
MPKKRVLAKATTKPTVPGASGLLVEVRGLILAAW